MAFFRFFSASVELFFNFYFYSISFHLTCYLNVRPEFAQTFRRTVYFSLLLVAFRCFSNGSKVPLHTLKRLPFTFRTVACILVVLHTLAVTYSYTHTITVTRSLTVPVGIYLPLSTIYGRSSTIQLPPTICRYEAHVLVSPSGQRSFLPTSMQASRSTIRPLLELLSLLAPLDRLDEHPIKARSSSFWSVRCLLNSSNGVHLFCL